MLYLKVCACACVCVNMSEVASPVVSQLKSCFDSGSSRLFGPLQCDTTNFVWMEVCFFAFSNNLPLTHLSLSMQLSSWIAFFIINSVFFGVFFPLISVHKHINGSLPHRKQHSATDQSYQVHDGYIRRIVSKDEPTTSEQIKVYSYNSNTCMSVKKKCKKWF